MSTSFSPIESEFSGPEEAFVYDQWFKAKVAKSLADTRPLVAHDEVMAGACNIIAKSRNKASNSQS